MSTALSTPDYPELETNLAASTDPDTQRRLLEKLVRDYVYTQPARAAELLDRWVDLAAAQPDEPLPYNYYHYRAGLANQAYREREALDFLEKGLPLVEEQGDLAERAGFYLDYVGVLINLKNLPRARDYFARAERTLAGFTPRPKLQARAHCRQGYLHLHSYNYAAAKNEFMLADRLLAEERDLSLKDHYFYTLIHAGHGTLLTDRPEEAAAAYAKAIARCETMGMTARLPWHRLALGEVALRDADYERARDIFRVVIESGSTAGTLARAQASANLALCYYHLDRPAGEITDLLDRAEQRYNGLRPPPRTNLLGVELQRAQLYLSEGDSAAAKQKLLELILDVPKAESEHNLDLTGQMMDALQMLSACYVREENYREAYHCERSHAEYVMRYNELLANKQQEIVAAQFAARRHEAERESLQLRASQLQLQALRAQMNPHFMYNALNSIQSFITQHDTSTASRYLAKFAMLMRRSLEYSTREYITLEEEMRFLRDYLDINCNLRFHGRVTYSVEADRELEDDILGVPTMILQPYVENAIEHGLRMLNKGTIRVEFRSIPGDDHNILATVTDNGVGRVAIRKLQAVDTTRAGHESRGTSITQSRLELLGAGGEDRVLIEDLYSGGAAAGTRVAVRIPVVSAW